MRWLRNNSIWNLLVAGGSTFSLRRLCSTASAVCPRPDGSARKRRRAVEPALKHAFVTRIELLSLGTLVALRYRCASTTRLRHGLEFSCGFCVQVDGHVR